MDSSLGKFIVTCRVCVMCNIMFANLIRTKYEYILLSIFIVSFIIHLPTKRMLKKNLHLPLLKLKYVVKWNENQEIACHFDTANDILPSAEHVNFTPGPGSIFFHETSCLAGLNPRQACVIESAAKLNPDTEIYVLFSGPLTASALMLSPIAILAHLANVHIARVHIIEYAKGTVLEELVSRRKNHLSKWPVEHTADILRLITLYKFGGICLDTDVMVVKKLSDLGENWVVGRDTDHLSSAAMAIGKDALGRKIIKKLMNELRINFNSKVYEANGVGIMTRIFQDLCNTTQVITMSQKTCGFQVLEPAVFAPIPFGSHDELKKKWRAKDILHKFDKSHAVHLWSKFTHNNEYKKGSLMNNLMMGKCLMIYYQYADALRSKQDLVFDTKFPDIS